VALAIIEASRFTGGRGGLITMSTADAALIALGERFERRLREYMDAWLAWAPLMRTARAEAESDLAGFTVAIQRTGCEAAQARMSEVENDMQPLAEEIIAAPAIAGGLRAKALVALWQAYPAHASMRVRLNLETTAKHHDRCSMRLPK
jgi:hypothetical protein